MTYEPSLEMGTVTNSRLQESSTTNQFTTSGKSVSGIDDGNLNVQGITLFRDSPNRQPRLDFREPEFGTSLRPGFTSWNS